MMQNNQNKVIGLTGGIASGKSTVSSYLVDLGYPVVDADKIAREVVEPGKKALLEITETFGSDYLNDDGSLNRKKLGSLVFANPDALGKLNAIMHSKIFERTWEYVTRLKVDHKIIFVDVPLLIESKQMSFYDEVWLVYVTRSTQLKRLMARDQIDLEFAEKILAAQMPLDEKRSFAHKIIENEGDQETLYEQVRELIKNIVY